MSKPLDICLTGPLGSAPSLLGAAMAILDSGVNIGNIYTSGGGVLVSLIIGSGYRPDAESIRVLNKILSVKTATRTYKNLWIKPRYRSEKDIVLDLDQFFSKSFSSFKMDTFFGYYDLKRNQIKEFGMSAGIKPVSMLLPLLNIDRGFSGEKLLGSNLGSLEGSRYLVEYMQSVNADIYIRGSLEIDTPYSGLTPQEAYDRIGSNIHLPEEIASKTLFLEKSSRSFIFGTPQQEISDAVNDAFRQTKLYLEGRDE